MAHIDTRGSEEDVKELLHKSGVAKWETVYEGVPAAPVDTSASFLRLVRGIVAPKMWQHTCASRGRECSKPHACCVGCAHRASARSAHGAYALYFVSLAYVSRSFM